MVVPYRRQPGDPLYRRLRIFTVDPALDFAALRFDGDPAHAASPAELRRQACALGHYLTRAEHPGYLDEFGMLRKGDPRLDGDDVSLPCVQSIRSARRAGPQGQVVFDLVAEVTQQRFVASSAAGPAFSYHGGATVILAPDGVVRLAIVKSVVGAQRLQRRRAIFCQPRRPAPLGRERWPLCAAWAGVQVAARPAGGGVGRSAAGAV